jgi:hypothetical protein
MAMIIVLLVWGFAYEWGYEQAEKDSYMYRQWVMRNHPANGEWE